jgi:hypothetical protein
VTENAGSLAITSAWLPLAPYAPPGAGAAPESRVLEGEVLRGSAFRAGPFAARPLRGPGISVPVNPSRAERAYAGAEQRPPARRRLDVFA